MGTRLHNTVLVTFREMRFLFIACLAVTVSAAPQANFGKKIEVNERLGLLANDLGLDPTAETSQSAALTAETSAGASGQLPSGRVPGGEEIGEPAGESQCCCADQFDHQFSNGTGVRCFVAGWGKDEHDGSFQFIPKKV